ncbi:hypothetical protein QM007_00510 [Rothia sp. SD9660Na]|uniref:hypothetical protein n=1 Tax=Rothia sp. SD9660Na TaxID=3047030 RepID=UPI0024BA4978|nr:hypothetical protein [Rothia sp. SD9660Na]WHS50507.1 hypothetical protein QM007_00510 [Rothia sp. SD9660Na]
MWSTHEAAQKIAATRDLPYGSARTAAMEYITRTLEREGPESMLPEAYLNLVEAYVFGQPTPASFAVFSKLLRLYDAHPEHFDEFTARTLFWQFKWIIGDMTAYPQISKAQARELLDEMRRRYRLAGMGEMAPDRAEYMWAAHIGEDEAAEIWRARWLAHGEDEMDCGSCRHGGILRDHVTDGDFEAAIRMGAPTEDLCNREPAASHRQLALAYLHLEDGEAAGRHLLRAAANRDQYDPDDLGVELEVLARGQNLQAAFDLLADHGKRALDLAGDPGDNRNFLRYIVAGLAWALEDHGDMPTGLRPDGQTSRATLRELYDWALAESRPLAQAFDRRAGNTRFSESLEAATQLDALVPIVLPTGADGAGSASSAGSAGADAAEGAQTGGAGATGATPLSFTPVESYLAVAREHEAAGASLEAGLAYAEAAFLVLAGGPVTGVQALEAHGFFETAWPLLADGGASPALLAEVVRVWAPVAERVNELEALRTPVGELQELAQQVAHPDLLTVMQAQDLAARLSLATGESAGQQLVDELVETYRKNECLEQAARLLVVAAEAAAATGQSELAIGRYELAAEFFEPLRLKKSRAAALDACIELLRATGQEHRVEALLAELVEP